MKTSIVEQGVPEKAVLIVEDEKHTRNTLCLVIENAGYTVMTASDGREALGLVLKLRKAGRLPDLLVLDLEMSGLTGLELLDALKKEEIGLPTVVITGFTEPRTLNAARARGCGEILAKPFDPDSFIAALRRVLAQAGGRTDCEPGAS
jgi:CheY-like chemotaxis protein